MPSVCVLPRHLFIPETVWVPNTADGPPLRVLRRDEDPDRWQALTDANDYVITQVDDGRPGPDPMRWTATSSASMPAMVAQMLTSLELHDGHRVLEIGTGTGWNAALLAHRLGSERVTTVEIDPEIATRARKALSDAGFGGVDVITGDGALGYPRGAPFDRVIVTAACEHIPYSWVEQTRSGGLILTPWANTYFDGGSLALTIDVDGTATGGIVGKCWFMWLRDQRPPRDAVRDIVSPEQDRAALPTTWADVHPMASPATTARSWRSVCECPTVGTSTPRTMRTAMLAWSGLPIPGRTRGQVSRTPAPMAAGSLFSNTAHGGSGMKSKRPTAGGSAPASPDADRWRFTVTSDGQRVELQPDLGS